MVEHVVAEFYDRKNNNVVASNELRNLGIKWEDRDYVYERDGKKYFVKAYNLVFLRLADAYELEEQV